MEQEYQTVEITVEDIDTFYIPDLITVIDEQGVTVHHLNDFGRPTNQLNTRENHFNIPFLFHNLNGATEDLNEIIAVQQSASDKSKIR